jgi:hypothetical protein
MGDKIDVAAAIEGMARVEEFNDQYRQPNPNGKYPLCKPKLFNIDYCERCGGWIKGVDGPCPAVPPEKRWGESNEGHDIVPRQSHERVKN